MHCFRRNSKGEPATWHPSAWSVSKVPFKRRFSVAGKCKAKSFYFFFYSHFSTEHFDATINLCQFAIQESFSSLFCSSFLSLSQFLRWKMGRISTFNGNYVFVWHLCSDALLHWTLEGKWTLTRPADDVNPSLRVLNKHHRFYVSHFIIFLLRCYLVMTIIFCEVDTHSYLVHASR